MRIFFDSSAFAKRYVLEPGSAEVIQWSEQADELCLSVIALTEIVSALCRLQREGRLARHQYHEIKSRMLDDIRDAAICDLTAEVIRNAIIALESSALRGMDALHVGAAQALNVDVFVSADAKQCAAASQVGLRAVLV